MTNTTLTCSQCGRPAPADHAELADWGAGKLLLAGELNELDELSAELLVCPDCVRGDRAGEYEAGGGD